VKTPYLGSKIRKNSKNERKFDTYSFSDEKKVVKKILVKSHKYSKNMHICIEKLINCQNEQITLNAESVIQVVRQIRVADNPDRLSGMSPKYQLVLAKSR
jgi:hypothetical protein